MTAKPPEVSVIVTIDSRHNDIHSLYYEYKNALQQTNRSCEFIYVLDGDFPNVLEKLKQLQSDKEPIKIIVLAKSFGEAAALTAGFEHCSAQYIVTLPAYYQAEPAEIPKILDKLSEYDMVVGRRWPRIDSRFNRLQTRLFNKILNFMTGSSFSDLGCNIRAFKRDVMVEVPIYGAQDRFFPVLANYRGFRVKEVGISQSAKNIKRRVHPLSAYPSHLLDILAVLFLVRFTKRPLRFFGPIGTLTLGIGGIILLYVVFERLFLDIALADRPALLLSSLLVVLGAQILALGLLGELIIFAHARTLKEYTIAEIIN